MSDVLVRLYRGRTADARLFRFALLAFDAASIAFFIVSSLARDEPWVIAVDDPS